MIDPATSDATATPVDPRTEHDELGALLRSLPREQASPGFTEAVLERTRADDRSRSGSRAGWWSRLWRGGAPRWQPLLAAAAVLVLVLGFGWRELERERADRATDARIAALRAEYDALALELEETRRLVEQARPVVYLGGDESTAVHVDLATLARRQLAFERRAAQAVPARLDERTY